MGGRGANVRSVEAIEAFRAALVVYVAKASQVLGEVGDEVRRTRLWVQQDQPRHWEGELRRRTRKLDQARQELLSARLSNLRERTARQEAMVRRAQEAVREAEDKLRRLKAWNRHFESRVGTLAKKVDSLEDVIKRELPKAIAHLAELEKRIEAYRAVEAPARASATGEIGHPASPGATTGEEDGFIEDEAAESPGSGDPSSPGGEAHDEPPAESGPAPEAPER